jgi:hypothetical protein
MLRSPIVMTTPGRGYVLYSEDNVRRGAGVSKYFEDFLKLKSHLTRKRLQAPPLAENRDWPATGGSDFVVGAEAEPPVDRGGQVVRRTGIASRGHFSFIGRAEDSTRVATVSHMGSSTNVISWVVPSGSLIFRLAGLNPSASAVIFSSRSGVSLVARNRPSA